jgi:signal transduction histidine kinase
MISNVASDLRSPRTYGRILYLFLAFPLGLLWFCVLVIGISAGLGLAITLIGLPILVAMLYLSRWMAQGERMLIGRLLGVEIADPYRAPPPHAGHWALIRSRLSDPATWKDLLFLLFQFPLGTLAFSLATALIGGAGYLVAAPAWYSFQDPRLDLGFMTVDTLAEALVLTAVGLVLLPVAIVALNQLGRGYGWLAAQLLGSNADPELTAEVVDLRDSRARVIAAADAERKRLERDLHDGAQQRLVSLALTLRMAEQRAAKGDPEAAELVRQAGAEAGHALEELRDLARGIHPAILTNRGLPAALDDLASRAALPVEVVAKPDDRLPERVEAAAYFVVSEALANIAKHAQASSATISVVRNGDALSVEVSDDGVGGAELDGGSGLQGLADRVGALNGRLDLQSPPEGGTRLRASLPLALPEADEEDATQMLDEATLARIAARRRDLLKPRLFAVAVVELVLVAIWALTPSPSFWPIWPLIGLTAVAAADAAITLAGGPAFTPAACKRRFLVVKGWLYAIVNAVVIAIWAAAGGGDFWPIWVLFGTSLGAAGEYLRFRYAN